MQMGVEVEPCAAWRRFWFWALCTDRLSTWRRPGWFHPGL